MLKILLGHVLGHTMVYREIPTWAGPIGVGVVAAKLVAFISPEQVYAWANAIASFIVVVGGAGLVLWSKRESMATKAWREQQQAEREEARADREEIMIGQHLAATHMEKTDVVLNNVEGKTEELKGALDGRLSAFLAESKKQNDRIMDEALQSLRLELATKYEKEIRSAREEAALANRTIADHLARSAQLSGTIPTAPP